ncbi:peroxisomal leader peptide-processing protease isoform X2 [Paroedura picta]|uniref:peroxisomal leader peptide-processing protease isoform X2 n=1 Tax=Paroedura picta TaxID=143630 RepID=UPI004057CADC
MAEAWRRAGEAAGCVVAVEAPGSVGGGPWSGSGVVLPQSAGVVVCHAGIFAPFLLADGPRRPALLLPDDFSPGLRIRVLRPAASARTPGSRRAVEESAGRLPALKFRPLSGGAQAPPGGLASHEAALVLLVPCRRFQEAFAGPFAPSDHWHFGGGGEEEGEAELLRFLPWFAVLRLLDGDCRGAAPGSCMPAARLRQGDPLLACGSPFGAFCPDIFLNTLSRGIVSNLAGEGNALILTDARCLPGTEGGAVFAISAAAAGPQLVGLIVAPLCWKSNEWVGLTLVCALDCVLESIRNALSEPGLFPNIPLPALPPVATDRKRALATDGPLRQMLAAVVLVECGQSWGSGVMVRSRVVLTCRHVVSGASRVRVRIRPSSGRALVTRGKVVFATQDASPYDIALLELEDGLSTFVDPVLASSFYEGEDVSMVGFGAFGQACGPSVTSGILSAVIMAEEKPVMLQATCAVQGGSSGGALFATRSGELLGRQPLPLLPSLDRCGNQGLWPATRGITALAPPTPT